MTGHTIPDSSGPLADAPGAALPDAVVLSAAGAGDATLAAAPVGRLGRLIRRGAWSVLVLGALVGVVYGGYRAEWRLPKFAELVGTARPAAADDWCAEHSVPESACIACDPKLAQAVPDYGWCPEHGVAQCLLHHPDLAQGKTPYRPSAADFERAERALALLPRSENNPLCKLHQKQIQFASDEALAKAGVEIAVVTLRPVTETIVGNGELVYDQARVAHLSSRAAGTVVYAQRQVGETVSPGDVLALIDCVEVGKAKAAFLESIGQYRLSEATVERLRPLVDSATIPLRQFREAEAALQTAEVRRSASLQALVNLGFAIDWDQWQQLDGREIAERLQYLGIPQELVSLLREQTAGGFALSSNLFALRAPLAGTIVERDVVMGEVVDSNKLLFTLADPRRMWLLLKVRQEDADFIRVGQEVRFQPGEDRQAGQLSLDPESGSHEAQGRVSWINTSADERTRTVEVRVFLENPTGRLRANTFGTGRIVLRQESESVVIPSQALHWDGDCHVVFVRDQRWFDQSGPKFFHVRQVRLGVQTPEQTEILVGLAPGEVLASKNSVVLESQLLKSKLGDGCGCAH